jgi:nitroreductase
MHVAEAVASRYSCRAFLPTPVPLETVRDILERAARAPSGGNVQPWHVHVLAGEPLAALKRGIAARPDELPYGEGAEYDIYPRPLKEPYESRRRLVGELLYRAIKIQRADRPGRIRQYARNYLFFDAPVGMFFSLDRSMGPPQWSDFGMYIQSVSLLARGHGLHTCAQEAWTFWHKTVGALIELPEERMLFCGMGLGYADAAAPINNWRSPREPVEAFATFAGFEPHS